MVVTQRRNRADPAKPEARAGEWCLVLNLSLSCQSRANAYSAGIEPGIKITCDFCESYVPGACLSNTETSGHLDITHSTVRFKCADPICEDIDVCPSCFCEGREGQRHKAWHDYRVEVNI